MSAPDPQDSPLPPALRWTGPLLAGGFALGVGLRKFAYAVGLKSVQSADIPVISIGNLSAGGTGKTPATAYVAKGLLERGYKPAILTRGYGAEKSGGQSDEARELELAVPGVPVIVNPKRIEGANEARKRGCTVAILDDGFQHWQLKRKLDIVLIDATRAFETAHQLPWGYLREYPSALRRAGAILVTRADQAGETQVQSRINAIRSYVSEGCLIAQASHRPVGLWNLKTGDDLELETLRGKRLWATCGIGNPGAFHRTLELLGAKVEEKEVFPDHYNFKNTDGFYSLREARERGLDAVVVTEKDAVKWEAFIPAFRDLEISVWVLRVAFEVTSPTQASEFWAQVEQAIRAR